MPKFFFAAPIMNEITLSSDLTHHLLQVLRLKPGDDITLCDGNRTDYFCELLPFRPKEKCVRVSVHSSARCATELPFRITLYQGLPKRDKLELIIQKGVELGVTCIVPVQTSRSVVRVKDVANKTERYQRIAESAAGQSMRGIIPVVSPPVSFSEALIKSAESLCLVAWEYEKTIGIRKILAEHPPCDIGLWIGPEGGLSEVEVQMLMGQKTIPFSLGRRILRTETAGLAAVAQVLCCWEEF